MHSKNLIKVEFCFNNQNKNYQRVLVSNKIKNRWNKASIPKCFFTFLILLIQNAVFAPCNK